MKLTAVSFTVILLVAGMLLGGVSCVTKDKTAIVFSDNSITLPVTSLKEEQAAPAPQPVHKKLTLPKRHHVEMVDTHIETSVCGRLIDYGDVIPPPVEEKDSAGIKEDDSDVLMACNLEVEAEYPGGNTAWLRFLKKNLKYPKDSIGNRIEGKVVVRFVVDETGNVSDVEAVYGSEILGAEAVRVIKQSRKWIPAKRYSTGRSIRTYKKQPFIFKVQ